MGIESVGPESVAGKRSGRRNPDFSLLEDHLTVVYLIAPDSDGPTKIGVSGNLQVRISALQTGSWAPLSIYGFRVAIPEMKGGVYGSIGAAISAGAMMLEREAHEVLSEMGLRMCGEWFDISPRDAGEVLAKCGARRGVKAISLEQVAGAEIDAGWDPAVAKAQGKIVASMAAVSSYVHYRQPYPAC